MKKIFYFLALITALLLPSIVKAESYCLQGGQLWQYHALTPIKNISEGIGELAGANYFYTTSQIPNGDFYKLIFPFKEEGSFTINGSLFIDLKQNISYTSFPLALNGIVCEVTPLYELSNNGDMARRIFSFSCPNVTMRKENNNSFVFQSNMNAVNNIFGISYCVTTSSSISSSIDNQTNAIQNGFNGLQEQQQETNKQLGDLNDNLTNSDTSEASGSANEFFSGFESDDFGLTAIITAPLNFIKSLTSSTCTPLGFNAPFVNQRVTLPCMRSIYEEHFGGFLTLYQTITFGIVAYWVCVNTLASVRGFKDPDSDRIEVLDL